MEYVLGIKSSNLLYFEITDSNGKVVGTPQSGFQLQVPLYLTYVGRYYVHIYPYPPNTANYTVSLSGYDCTQTSFPIRFSSPDSTTNWTVGAAYNISWTPDTLLYGSAVDLQLYRDSTLVQSITKSKYNMGLHSWIVTVGTMASNRYRIRISNSISSEIYGYSPYFTISTVNSDAYEP